MLKKVYIHIKKFISQSQDLEVLREQCQEKGISVALIGGEEQLQLTSEETAECVLITDSALDKDFHMTLCNRSLSFENVPLVGVGFDYPGSCTYLIEDLTSVDLHYLEMIYARFHHLPLTIVETERLVIREMTMNDLDALYELYETLSDCAYIEQLYERSEEEEFTRKYIKNMYGFFGYGLWLVFEKQSGRLIGRAGIENREIDGENVQELGYLIGKPWQHDHYATEACKAIIHYAKEQLVLDQLYLCTHETNTPSITLAQKLGFTEYALGVEGMNIYHRNLS